MTSSAVTAIFLIKRSMNEDLREKVCWLEEIEEENNRVRRVGRKFYKLSSANANAKKKKKFSKNCCPSSDLH